MTQRNVTLTNNGPSQKEFAEAFTRELRDALWDIGTFEHVHADFNPSGTGEPPHFRSRDFRPPVFHRDPHYSAGLLTYLFTSAAFIGWTVGWWVA